MKKLVKKQIEYKSYDYNTGVKIKSDFILNIKKTTSVKSIMLVEKPFVILEMTHEDLMKISKIAKKRNKLCGDFNSYFVHLAPDVSVFVKSKKKKR